MGRRRRRPARPAAERSGRRVRATGDSSAASKCSAAALRYTRDRFAQLLLPPPGRPRRRAPAIHRGYYVRARAVEHCARAFLLGADDGRPRRRQLVSLGAGCDSLYFLLKSEGLLRGAVVFEVDFPDVVRRKAALVAAAEELASLAGSDLRAHPTAGAVAFSGVDYRLLGVDLSEIPKLEEALCEAGLDPSIPTMLLAEVVLAYLDVQSSDALIQWAAKHFLEAWFVLYEQIHPEDPFGRIMENHFSRLSSPLCSLSRYPNCKAQEMRFLRQGWEGCASMNMNEFFRGFVPRAEQQRIQMLEPFDEFEEWHLKCSHYFILVASKGEKEMCPVFPGIEACLTRSVPVYAGTVVASVCEAGEGMTNLRRFGHRSVLVSPHVVLTTGGFGDQQGHHCRLRDLHALVKHHGAWTSVDITLTEPGEAWDGRLFHTMTMLRAGWAVVLGGRKSPLSSALETCCLRVWDAPGSPVHAAPIVEVTQMPAVKDLNFPRWRHTATEVVHKGEAYLFVYGGCSSKQSVLMDWCFLHLEELCCRQISVEGVVPVGRHSHSACGWAGGVVIAGGLAEREELLGSILFLKPSERGFQWHLIETCPPITPRYSHTAHVHREKLLLVGGVWLCAPEVPGVTVIDLVTGVAEEYRIDTGSLEWPLMLHNHSSVFLPEEETVFVLGGGGNCFSFGTHFNQHPVRLGLSSLWGEQ